MMEVIRITLDIDLSWFPLERTIKKWRNPLQRNWELSFLLYLVRFTLEKNMEYPGDRNSIRSKDRNFYEILN